VKASTLNALLVAAAAVATAVAFTSGRSAPTTPGAPPPIPPPAPPLSKRGAVALAALSQLGNGDPKRYWDDVLPGVSVGKADWCGAGALWCLHQAGLALGRHWILGSGFLLTPPALPTTKRPQIGDIAYFVHNQHHAVVVGVTPGTVRLVNFNGIGGLVSESNIDPMQATAFFSIAPLISSANA